MKHKTVFIDCTLRCLHCSSHNPSRTSDNPRQQGQEKQRVGRALSPGGGGQRPTEASSGMRKHCHIRFLYWLFRNEEECEAMSLREGSVRGEGLVGIHVGGEARQILVETDRKRQVKVQRWNTLIAFAGWLIPFLFIFVTHPASELSLSLCYHLQPLGKCDSCERKRFRHNYFILGQSCSLFSFTTAKSDMHSPELLC